MACYKKIAYAVFCLVLGAILFYQDDPFFVYSGFLFLMVTFFVALNLLTSRDCGPGQTSELIDED